MRMRDQSESVNVCGRERERGEADDDTQMKLYFPLSLLLGSWFYCVPTVLFSYHVCVVASVDLLLLFLRPVSLMVDESLLGVG